jgi:SNF2 family DNA or RNA helicase
MWNSSQTLYPYQERAARTMCKSDVLLAFDMGTGKSPTTLWALEELRGAEFIGPGTVVVPASLKWQWKREIEKFTDQTAVVVDGTAKQRQEQYLTVRETGAGYVVMSYGTFVRDWNYHSPIAPGFLVLDEATAIKSFRSQRSQHIKKVRNRYNIRFALTGTPIENGRAEEVFSIMEFVDPRVLGGFWDFEKRYIRRNTMGWIEGYMNLGEFHKKLKPYVLRATHDQPEVAKYLPTVLEMDPVVVHLDKSTSNALRWIERVLLSDLDAIAVDLSHKDLSDLERGEDHPDGKLMAKIQTMRMLLDHPDAVRDSAVAYGRGDSKKGSAFSRDIVIMGLLDNVRRTPKLDALEQYLKDFLDIDPTNKAVVFSSFVLPAERICERFPDISTLFTGAMSSKQRDASKQKFASDPQCRLFISTDAGGYGLDLPEANLLVNFDMPWQAGMLKQRSARIKRASSDWSHVIVQDFLVKGSIEERMREMLMHKIAVSDAIVDGLGITEGGGVASDLGTLRAFLADNDSSRLIYAS